jgi:antitoxin component YwqK of YwqJK toxin-antitoxin module
MTRKKLSISSSTWFTLLVAQLILTQSLQAAPSQGDRVPTPATKKRQSQRLEKLSRPVRPKRVESSQAVMGEEIFTERYPDGSVRIEREVSLDTDGNYVNHGPYRLWSRNGDLIAEGDYDMGKRVGVWTRWADRKESPLLNEPSFKKFSAPFLSQASFVDGIVDGEWLIFDANQRKCSQISIKQGKRHGLALLWTPNGNIIQQSSYENGMPQGDVLKLKGDKGVLSRVKVYLDGREVINEKTNFPRTKVTKTEANYLAAPTVQTKPDDFWNIRFATYKSDGKVLRHGEWKTWRTDGKLQLSGQYARDQKVGHFVYWHTNGQISAEGEFYNDKHEGDWVWWHSNGQKAVSGSFQNGTLVDQWYWWNKSGQLTKQIRHDGTKTMLSGDIPELELVLREKIGSKVK